MQSIISHSDEVTLEIQIMQLEYEHAVPGIGIKTTKMQ